jgi:hypothetical protein
MATQEKHESRNYEVRAYFGGNMRGLSEDRTCRTHNDMVDTVHEFCFNGNYVRVQNIETGATLEFDPDTWMESIDLGDVPEVIKSL